MMMFRLLTILTVSLLIPFSVAAMEADQQHRFDRIMKMKMVELTAATETLLEEKYPALDWTQQGFPDFVFINDSIEMGYRIALVAPKLLGRIDAENSGPGIPCYCSCDAFGHKSLLWCFLRKGALNKGYDEHGSQCNICVVQAMLAFLWQDAGASHEEIIAGMEKKFARLLEQRNHP